MEAAEVLAMVGDHVDEELLLRNEYLAAENEILKSKIEGPVRLTDPERMRLAKVAKRLGRKALEGVPCVVKPDTLPRWHRDLVAKKFDGSKQRRGSGGPRVTSEIEELVVRLAEENPDWGYDRVQGALANLGHVICDETVGSILRRNGIPPAPERKKDTTWTDFIHAHRGSIAAMDFFTTAVITHRGLLTVYVLFVIRLASREVHVAGLTPHPDDAWMKQMARNLTMADIGFLDGTRYLVHDLDSKFCLSFDQTLRVAGVKPVKLPPQQRSAALGCRNPTTGARSKRAQAAGDGPLRTGAGRAEMWRTRVASSASITTSVSSQPFARPVGHSRRISGT